MTPFIINKCDSTATSLMESKEGADENPSPTDDATDNSFLNCTANTTVSGSKRKLVSAADAEMLVHPTASSSSSSSSSSSLSLSSNEMNNGCLFASERFAPLSKSPVKSTHSMWYGKVSIYVCMYVCVLSTDLNKNLKSVYYLLPMLILSKSMCLRALSPRPLPPSSSHSYLSWSFNSDVDMTDREMSHSKIDSPQVKNVRMSTLVKRQRYNNTVTNYALGYSHWAGGDLLRTCMLMYVCM